MGRDTEVSSSKAMREWIAIILSAGALITAAWIEVTHNDKENAVKIASLEAHQQDDHEMLKEVKTDVGKLVELFLGKQQQ